MSAILSADDLNDFISPGVACIKPVETLPLQKPTTSTENEYEVVQEDKIPVEAAPAQISLTDCLACSGCVTSAEAVLVSLQSHAEVLNALDSKQAFSAQEIQQLGDNQSLPGSKSKRIFVASVSPQVRASLAVTYGTTEQEAGHMIDQLFCGFEGLSSGGAYGNNFAWTIDTNVMRETCLDAGSEEVLNEASSMKPILASACPGWVCYAEKTHPHVLPHLSMLKSPQALTGTLLKTVLSKQLNISPDQIYHLAVMPCFDKKLEGARQELTDHYWQTGNVDLSSTPIRDVDCVITAREILMLAESRGISYPSLPRRPVTSKPTFPDSMLSNFLFPSTKSIRSRRQPTEAGTSGGYLHHILKTVQLQRRGSTLQTIRGRNADVIEYTITSPANEVIFRAARYYGFRNIQNLVRKLKPAKISKLSGRAIGARKPGATTSSAGAMDYSYVEVMACPGGCTNGGGQIKFDDLGSLQSQVQVGSQKEWLGMVDEAYYSMSDSEEEEDRMEIDNEEAPPNTKAIVQHWSAITGIPIEKLLYTTFREVVSDVGKNKKGNVERVAEIATKMGGGW